MPGDIHISVDRDFARFGAKSYAINKINSVEVRKRHPYGLTIVFVAALAAVFCLMGGRALIVLALVFTALAVWAWRRSRIVEYHLFLMPSSSEAQAITSRDANMIDNLRDRIERAMSGQLA